MGIHQVMSLNDWLDHFLKLGVSTADKPISRLQYLADALNICHLTGTLIAVTGTNGKGSTVKVLEQIYTAAGYSVAAFTSPHIIQINERLTLNGKLVDDALLVEALAEVERLRDPNIPMSWYDAVYLALGYCVQQWQPEVILLEAGVGGLNDFSNLFDNAASMITSIGLDHQSLLGDTREEIGFHKAHLGRAGRPLICADPNMPETVRTVAMKLGAKLIDTQQYHFEQTGNTWQWQYGDSVLKDLPRPPLKLSNVAAALMTVMLLQSQLPVARFAIDKGLSLSKLSGRFEVMQHNCQIVLDVGHNGHAMAWLAKQLADQPVAGQTYMLFALADHKALASTLKPMQGRVHSWYVAPLQGCDSYSPTNIVGELQALGEKNCYTNSSISQALELLLAQVSPQDRIVVCGSFFAVSEAKQFLGRRC